MPHISKEDLKEQIADLVAVRGNMHVFSDEHPAWKGICKSIYALQSLLDQPEVTEDANMPDTERCIRNLVIALVESKGWMRDYADSIIRDAIDRTHLVEGEPVAWRIKYTADGEPRSLILGHNAVGDYRMFDESATTEPLYTRPPAPRKPITAEMVTYKMMVSCNNNADSVLSPADFTAAVNAYLKENL
jgi:hypothetical protein